MQAKRLHAEYWESKEKNGETPKILCFSRRWTKCWRKEYNISLKHPNKRFSIAQNE